MRLQGKAAPFIRAPGYDTPDTSFITGIKSWRMSTQKSISTPVNPFQKILDFLLSSNFSHSLLNYPSIILNKKGRRENPPGL